MFASRRRGFYNFSFNTLQTHASQCLTSLISSCDDAHHLYFSNNLKSPYKCCSHVWKFSLLDCPCLKGQISHEKDFSMTLYLIKLRLSHFSFFFRSFTFQYFPSLYTVLHSNQKTSQSYLSDFFLLFVRMQKEREIENILT